MGKSRKGAGMIKKAVNGAEDQATLLGKKADGVADPTHSDNRTFMGSVMDFAKGNPAKIIAGGSILAGSVTGVSKLTQAFDDQRANETEKAKLTQEGYVAAFQSNLTQLDQSLSGHQAFIQRWEGSFWAPILQPIFDTVLKAFNQETITERLEKAHDAIDSAGEERSALEKDLEDRTFTQDSDLIVSQTLRKMGMDTPADWFMPDQEQPRGTSFSRGELEGNDQSNVSQNFSAANLQQAPAIVNVPDQLEANGFGVATPPPPGQNAVGAN